MVNCVTNKDNEPIILRDRWSLFEAMFREQGLVRQHLVSFDKFISQGLMDIVREVDTIQPDIEGFFIKLDHIELGEPSIREADGSERSITPMEARIRNLIYSVPLFLVMQPVFIEDGIEREDQEKVKAYIGRLPIMLKSKIDELSKKTSEELIDLGEDPTDPGGYFVINGSERVIVTQEYLVSNRVLVDVGHTTGSVTATAKVFSTIAGFRSLVTVEKRKNGMLNVNFHSVPRAIPLAILVKALGVNVDRDIAQLVSDDPEVLRDLLPTLREAAEIISQEEALDFIGKRVAVGQTRQLRINRANQVLNSYLLPHLGTTEDFRYQKALFLAQMAYRVIEADSGRMEPDDKDHYANKRLKLAGEMLTSLFRVAFKSLCRDIKYQLEKGAKRGRYPNLRTAMRADVITERVRHALATGNWVGGKAGVSQLLDRTNFMSTLSHLRRVISPLTRSQAHFEARDLHATHWGKICVTPDTHVLLGDNYSQTPIIRMAKDYDSFSVITIDENSHEQLSSKIVAYQQVSAQDLGKRVFEIKTVSGRKIRATEDHPFLTDRGWVETGDLKLTDRVLIRPTLNPLDDHESEEDAVFTILDIDEFINGTWKSSLPDEEHHLVEKDAEKLINLGLLPLESDHPNLSILSRLLGAVITDGTVSNTIEFYLGSEADATAIHRDLETLGFIANPITEKKSEFHPDKTKDPVFYRTFRLNKGGAFKRLMMALGVPHGKRTEHPSIFPDWLLTCSKRVKREFIGAFMGGDGAVPWFYKRSGRKESYKIRLPEIEAHKHPSYIDSQILFFEKLKSLFKEFNIEVNDIRTKQIFQDRIAVKLIFDTSKDNIYRLCTEIGYRYCQEKEHKAQLIGEFLSFRKEEITQRERDREAVIELYDHGIPPKQISSMLNLGYRVVTSIVQRRHKERQVVRPKSSWSVAGFFENTNSSLETGMLYLPLSQIRLTDDDIVCDFTTALDTHSFVANGFVTHNCPNETPEGPNCGLVKNLSMMAYISGGMDEKIIEEHLFSSGVEPVVQSLDHSTTKVLLNGKLIGTSHDPETVVKQFLKDRRSGKIDHEANIVYYSESRGDDKRPESVLKINTDEGRVRRPLIIAPDGVPVLKKDIIEKLRREDWTWSDLIKNGIVEYLDADEEENALIALDYDSLSPEHTHLEISPSAILGICASIIPFAEHNQSPRNTYEAGMTKQALGLYAANFRYRTDRRSHLLQYPQIPLVGSRSMKTIGFNDRPAGQNFIVAVLSYQGWNIEDALVFNRASVERGLARSHFFRTYVAEEKKYPGGQEDRFEIPQKGVRGYRVESVYRHLSEDGLIEPEIEVLGGDVLTGKTSRPRFLEEYIELERPSPTRRETSISMRHGESGVIDTVVITETTEGSTLVKTKVRDQRVPEQGDKFASRHGQKGVIGHIVEQVDMPFTEDGIVPDLIINPHAIPSRMTVGQLLESMGAVTAAHSGNQVDATLFDAPSPESISKKLKELGFHPFGEQQMYDGVTGLKLPSRIFIGPVYYQKLHHLVADKIHARARGPIQILTRQPTEGRAREGGLRFGEMERDCLIGHGAALLLKERLLDESDKVDVLICEKCGLLAYYDRKRDQAVCPVCGTRDKDISRIAVSYAFKLLVQELLSLGIAPSIKLTEYA